MEQEKYTITHMTLKAILGLIEAKDIAIPEIQRPFVWKKSQVRDLLDSIYRGYPVGYIILWKNPNVKTKDGSFSQGRKVIIDGQQRITALMTAVAGVPVYNENYVKDRVRIAFDPFEAFNESEDARIFEVQTPAILKSKRWIPDVAEIFSEDFDDFTFIPQYCEDNPEMEVSTLNKIIKRLRSILSQTFGIIELSADLPIDIVTDIFVRINSKGTALNQGDFVMSKIAADEEHGGNTLRKIIDYFCHLAVEPTFYNELSDKDKEFCENPNRYIDKLKWLKDDTETVYDPDCQDVIRVAFMHKFWRSKLADLVSLLSGRNFETRENEAEIIDNTYEKFYAGVLNVIDEYNFKQFMIAIRAAGFISPKMVNGVMSLDFAYTLYLILRESREVPVADIKRIIQKWYVLSVLTGRYSSSPESAFYKDLKQISETSVVETLNFIEAAELSENFWNVGLARELTATNTKNPVYLVYLAAQVYFNEISLLSNNVSVRTLIELGGDVHHIFPKAYLQSKGFDRNKYNQLANYAYLDTPVNISIGKDAPCDYFSKARKQCEQAVLEKERVGSITVMHELTQNLATNCVPEEVFSMDYHAYDRFLEDRRKMMAKKIRDYYYSL